MIRGSSLIKDPLGQLGEVARLLGVPHQRGGGGEVLDLAQPDGEGDVPVARRRQDDGDALLERVGDVAADPEGPRYLLVPEGKDILIV